MHLDSTGVSNQVASEYICENGEIRDDAHITDYRM